VPAERSARCDDLIKGCQSRRGAHTLVADLSRTQEAPEVDRQVGLWLIGVGGVAIIVGVLAWSGALSWFGRLPGDIRYTSENVRVYVPITSMLVFSLLLNAVIWLFLWLFRR
jgi:uncharacterized membrane protein YidH (DUF202 family)